MSDKKFKVEVYQYDLSMGLAKQFSQQFTGKEFEGIWHTSVVVYGWEYFFGGGVQRLRPGYTPYGQPTKKITIGETFLPQNLFEQYLNELRRTKFDITKYDLFDNNCNHFTETCVQLLTSKSIPKEVKDLPKEFLETEMGKKVKPMIDAMMGGLFNFGGNDNNQQQTSNNNNNNTSTTTTTTNTNNNNTNTNTNNNNNMFGGGSGNTGMPQMNPEMMQNMMSSPMVQNMLSNPQVLREMFNNPMVRNNPMFQNMANNPMMQNLLNNPEQLANMFQDPMVQQLMRDPSFMRNAMNQQGNMGNMMGNMGNMGNMMGNMDNMFGGGNNNNNNNSSSSSSFSSFNPWGGSNSSNTSSSSSSSLGGYNDDQKVFRHNKSNVPAVMKKLKDFLKEGQIQNSVTEETMLQNIEKYLGLKKKEEEDHSLITDETLLLLNKYLTLLDEKKLYPVLDIFRLLVLSKPICQRSIELKEGPLHKILNDFLPKWDTFGYPTQLMILRVFCNIFSNKKEAKMGPLFIILNSAVFEAIAELITSSLVSQYDGVRLTAACLACNLSLFVPKDGNDEETQILCSMVEYVKNEKNDTVLFRMFLAIYRLMKDFPSASELVKTLDLNLSRISTKTTKKETLQLIMEVEKMMK